MLILYLRWKMGQSIICMYRSMHVLPVKDKSLPVFATGFLTVHNQF